MTQLVNSTETRVNRICLRDELEPNQHLQLDKGLVLRLPLAKLSESLNTPYLHVLNQL